MVIECQMETQKYEPRQWNQLAARFSLDNLLNETYKAAVFAENDFVFNGALSVEEGEGKEGISNDHSCSSNATELSSVNTAEMNTHEHSFPLPKPFLINEADITNDQDLNNLPAQIPHTLADSIAATIPETVEEKPLPPADVDQTLKVLKDQSSRAITVKTEDNRNVTGDVPLNAASRKMKLKRLAMPHYESLALSHSSRRFSSAASSPLADSSVSDDDNISSVPRCIASSSPPVCDITAARRGSSGLAATMLARMNSGKPLRMSTSATHLPLSYATAMTISKCTFPCCSSTAPIHGAMLNRDLSDSESVGSADSNQDLSVNYGTAATNTQIRLHRHSGGGGNGLHPARRSVVNAGSDSVASSSPTHNGNGSLAAQVLNSKLQQAITNGMAHSLVARSLSNHEDFSSQITTPTGGCSPTAFEQDSHLTAKHLNTEKVVSKHSLKRSMSKLQRLLDKAIALINSGAEDSIIEACGIITRVMENAWITSKIGHDLACGLCDYLRQMTYLDLLSNFFLHVDTKKSVRLAAGQALEECLSSANLAYIATASNGAMLDRFVDVVKSMKHSNEEVLLAISLLESLFKHSAATNLRLIESSALDYILHSCNPTTTDLTHRHAALALANLAVYSDNECRQCMVAKNVPDWLFFLASSQDSITRYYACLSACVLVAFKEIETAVWKSGTLDLVEQFLLSHKPTDFAQSDYKNIQGRPKEWLEKLVHVLTAKRREPRSMAAFHFAMEAGIKKDQERLDVFANIGAVDALKQVAALPEDAAPKFASMALEIIGAEVPHKLSPQVPQWTVMDVQYWVQHVGFEEYAQVFADHKVDGDLLLLLREADLKSDIRMGSSLLRRRFMRELEALKMAADYSCVDATNLDRFLLSIDPRFSMYTYQLLELGVDLAILPSITDEMLKSICVIENPIHRLKLLQAAEECKHIDDINDLEIAQLSKHIDIFISYRRGTGNQLASLIKVLLQLRGYKVFIDVDRLYAGKFDCSLLKNIQAAKHFIMVLSPHALDRCIDDDGCNDWVHKELLCAIECNKNIIPVFDPQFEWPDECRLPSDMRAVTRFNGVRWVHEYQEACVNKLEKFIEGELNIDRGFYPLPHLSHCSQLTYSQAISNRLATSLDDTDLVLDALNCASRSRTESEDQLTSIVTCGTSFK